MHFLFEPLTKLEEFTKVKAYIEHNQLPVHVTGCLDSQKSHFIAALGQETKFKIIIAENEWKAKNLYDDLKMYDKQVYLYPAKDVLFYHADVRSNAIVRQRLQVRRRMHEQLPTYIVTTMDAGMEHLLSMENWGQHVFTIAEAQILDLEVLQKKLVAMGYERVDQVDSSGQFAVRGGIFDIFPLTEETPFRMELWDDEVDTIRSFDVESQRSIERVEQLTIYPATEVVVTKAQLAEGIEKMRKACKKQVEILRKQFKTEEAHRLQEEVEEQISHIEIYGVSAGLETVMPFFFGETESFFSYFSNADSLFFVDEPAHVEEHTKAVELEFRESMSHRLEKGYVLPQQTDIVFSYEKIQSLLHDKATVLLSMLDYGPKGWKLKEKADLMVTSVPAYHQNFEMLINDLKDWKAKNNKVVLFSNSVSRAKRLSEELKQYQLPAFYNDDPMRSLQNGEIMVVYGNLHKGFTYPLLSLVVISESDMLGEKKARKKPKKKQYDGRSIQSFTELNIGDYVIHENHGIGVYQGLEKITIDKVVKDYVKITYADGGNVYVLATGLDVLQRVSSADGKRPKIDKLNSNEWRKNKNKAKASVRLVAKELVELYAKREAKKGYAFAKDTSWQREFEEMFPYEETQDQLHAIQDTKKDMESDKIMDRLVCGDVGFGKTEIAIRAAFKAVMDGKQVALLVPTTILAQQHYNTFVQRMKEFPVRIGMLSRFRTKAQQNKDLEDLRNGKLDIVIGTHRLLSKDVSYKRLGLLIVDEEQRFGVTHKEKIKMLKENVDVLTLSATPIPRTLHMSLIGIRDMSVLEEPPIDRLPIQTFVVEQNDEIVREAISRELARNGQVFYVYNRVQHMDEIANYVQGLVPDARVAFAHGQMQPRQLGKIMYEYINGEIDVLVATTIIETGLDIANVNTMIIHDADQLGLSQLYQLRGRVGRTNRRAYAFLLYRKNKILKEVAEKRLQAMREFTELGSGFKIAMTDLEIRGAGSLLGEQQHGHMEAIGYDLYCKMLHEAVLEFKDGIIEEHFETAVDVDYDAYIPATYMRSEYQRLEMYKRIADIENVEEWQDIQDELMDRFGELPKVVENLLSVVLIKALAHKIYISKIKQQGTETVVFTMYEKAKINVAALPVLMEKYPKVLQISTQKQIMELTYHWNVVRGKQPKGKVSSKVFFEKMTAFLTDLYDILKEREEHEE